MELSRRLARLSPLWTTIVAILLLPLFGGCSSDGLPYAVSRSWFDQNWDLQQPMVQIAGVDEGGWRHFVVTAGVITGSGASVHVSRVWTAAQVLFIGLEYNEPRPDEGSLHRVARLEVEVPQNELPDPITQVVLVSRGEDINIAVSSTEAIDLVRAQVQTKAVGLGSDTARELTPSLVLLLRGHEGTHTTWRWLVELKASGSQQGSLRVHGTVDATTGTVVELVID